MPAAATTRPASPARVGTTDAAPGIPFFSARKVVRCFGALAALDGLSFDVRQGEILGIAGPNGAGKSTLLHVCGGHLAPTSGEIRFEGSRVSGLPPHRLCRLGIGRTFQIPRVFSSMNVEENVGAGRIFGGAGVSAAEDPVPFLMEICGLAAHRHAPAARVSLMIRKMTMLAAVLATGPKIVFMDEPLAGLNRDEIAASVDLIRRLHEELDITFVVVEHKIRALSRFSDRLMVMHFGRCLRIDAPEVVVRDTRVVEVYLGTEFDA